MVLHVAVFFALAHLVIFQAPPPDELSAVFVRVTLPRREAPEIPPPPPDMPTLPAMTSPSSGTSMPMPIVVNTTMPKFTVAMPSINDPALSQHLSDSLHATGLAGHGSGTGTGSGNGTSTGTGDGTGAGDTADICGLKIPTRENVVVIEDVWQAWHSSGTTSTKVQRYAEQCISKFFFGTTPIQVNGDLTYYNPQNPRIHSSGDLYEAAYSEEDAGPDGKAPTVILIISTWVNVGETSSLLPESEILRAEATETFVASLRKHHIKLYLLSTKVPPFHVLSDYAKESGGQVSITPELDLTGKN
jgi:hypothetical protein